MILFVLTFTLFGAVLGLPHGVPTGRINGGQQVDISKYPYAVQIFYMHLLECGGILLTNKYVLTAAHCVYKKNMIDYKLRVGTTNLDNGGQTFTVTGIAIHPKYVWESDYYDASILLLSGPVTVGSAKPAQWATKNNGLITRGAKVYIAGWGWPKLTNYDEYSPTLLQAELSILDDATCLKTAQLPSIEATFCANYSGSIKDFCFGDYGGPAVINGVVHGIISFGEGCGDGYNVKGFLRTSKIEDWIEKTIKK